MRRCAKSGSQSRLTETRLLKILMSRKDSSRAVRSNQGHGASPPPIRTARDSPEDESAQLLRFGLTPGVMHSLREPIDLGEVNKIEPKH